MNRCDCNIWCVWDWRSTYVVWSWYDWNAQMSGMWVQSAVCADVARCGSGMSGMWPRGSRTLVHLQQGMGFTITNVTFGPTVFLGWWTTNTKQEASCCWDSRPYCVDQQFNVPKTVKLEINLIQQKQSKQESRAIARRTVRCRCKFRYVSNFTTASWSISVAVRLSCLYQRPFKMMKLHTYADFHGQNAKSRQYPKITANDQSHSKRQGDRKYVIILQC